MPESVEPPEFAKPCGLARPPGLARLAEPAPASESTPLLFSLSRRIRTSIIPLCTLPQPSSPTLRNQITASLHARRPILRPSSSSSSGVRPSAPPTPLLPPIAVLPPVAPLAQAPNAPNPRFRRFCCTSAVSVSPRTFSACASRVMAAEISRCVDFASASMASRCVLLR